MSEEAQEATGAEIPTVETDSEKSSLDDINDPKTLRKMVKTLRQENGNHRKRNNAVEGELDEYRKWKQDQLSELDRERSAKEQAIKERNQVLVDKLALEFGVDEEFVDFIVGTEDEMRERAKKLGRRSGDSSSEKAKARLLGGNRGTSIGKRTDGSNRDAGTTEADWFAGLYNSD